MWSTITGQFLDNTTFKALYTPNKSSIVSSWLHQWWPLHLCFFIDRAQGLLRCRLGRLPRHKTLDIRLVCSLGTRLSHGQQRDNRQSPSQVRKLSVGRWPTPPLNAAGCETYFRNFMFMSGGLLSSIVTTYQLYIYLRIDSSSMNEAH
jgi:hypothetical protein